MIKFSYFRPLKLIISLGFLCVGYLLNAQQLPNSNFEDWSAAEFDGNIQTKSWNASNVTQFGFKFNFAHRENGHSGWCMMVQDQSIGAAGITETSPGYFSLGTPWVYIEGLTKVNYATAGTYGGISWTHRPDTMEVWIKRTGDNVTLEDFHLLYYSWSGTAKGDKYKGKNGSCTSVSKTNEESDIRQALDANECGTTTKVTQVSEGWFHERKAYNNWAKIKVPIYYFNGTSPTMCNVIFSASNYPNFRANSGLYAGNSLYIDDVKLIYASSIQHLYIDGMEWKGFDPTSTEEQIYSLGLGATAIPQITARRGEGTLTNIRGTSASFPGRELTSSEMSIAYGPIGGVTTIQVKAEDGSSTTTYKIKFVREASANDKLATILVNGEALSNFKAFTFNYTAMLPYGTTQVPQVAAQAQDEDAKVQITQASSLTGQATIKVTSPNGQNTTTYVVDFSVAQLADNTLRDIKVDGRSLPGFLPTKTTMKISLPVGTTSFPVVEAVSAYPSGAQTIVITEPDKTQPLDGAVYTISVTTPGNLTPRVYKLNVKLEESSYSDLADLRVAGGYITSFAPTEYTYYVNLPLGTYVLPEISYTLGDSYQTVTIAEGGLDGTTRVSVLAGNQTDQSVYKIIFSTEKSEISYLHMIYVDGKPLSGFDSTVYLYSYELPIGTTILPEITYDMGDPYELVVLNPGGVNGITRIASSAGNGSTSLYQISFTVKQSDNDSLHMIYLDGIPLEGFSPLQTTYDIVLPKGTTQLPKLSYEKGDAYQMVNERPLSGMAGDYKLTVISQSGIKREYVLHFSVTTSTNTSLQMIYLDGKPMPSFCGDTLRYTRVLEAGVSEIPSVTWDKGDDFQKVIQLIDGTVVTLRVTSESGAQRNYVLQFEIQKSENAYLNMIYLNGDSLVGFQPENLTYSVPWNLAESIVVGVDKAEGQQLTISMPKEYGTIHIMVQPESGAPNVYNIMLVPPTSSEVLIDDILLDSISLAEFDSHVFAYDIDYIDVIPTVTYVAVGKHVTMLEHDSVVSLVVMADEQTATYVLTFHRILSANATLSQILLNGQLAEGFDPSTLSYSYTISAMDEYPEVSYVAGNPKQSITSGQISQGKTQIHVVAENGNQLTYMVVVEKQPYTDATLSMIYLDGDSMPNFAAMTNHYFFSIAKGDDLPVLTFDSKPGQHILYANTSDTSQQIVVIPQSGDANTYFLHYQVYHSSDVTLKDIRINGASIPYFEPSKNSYTVILPSRTLSVPSIVPVPQLPGQKITIYYGKPAGVTRIHVLAEDGVAEGNYYLTLPVFPLTNTTLKSLEVNEMPITGWDPQKTEYTIVLTESTDDYPEVTYEKAEVEQQIEHKVGPRGETWIKVMAENGDSRTYHVVFAVAEGTGSSTLKSLSVNNIQISLADDKQTTFEIPLAYGETHFDVAYEKQDPSQVVDVIQGNVYSPTYIYVRAKNIGDPDKIYTLIPMLEKYDPATLTSIKVNGNAITNFDPHIYNYVVNVTSKPTITAHGAEGVTVTTTQALNEKTKTIVFKATKGSYSNTYTVSYYYTNCMPPFDMSGDWPAVGQGIGYKPAGWIAPGDKSAGLTYEIKYVVNLTYTTGKEVIPSGNGVYLSTLRGAPMNGSVPGMITLGNMSLSLAKSGGSTSSVTKNASVGRAFYNTPEKIAWRAKPLTSTNITNWKMWLTLSDGTNYAETNYTGDFSKCNQWVDISVPINYGSLGKIVKLNAMLSSCDQENAKEFGGSQIYESDVIYEDIRFVYSSALTSVTINGAQANISGTKISYQFSNAEEAKFPIVKFTGEVADQMQSITWSDEVSGIRKASVRNFGEDGSYTDYELTITRPLSTNSRLSGIRVNGAMVANFSPSTTDYDYVVSSTAYKMPDVVAVPAGNFQKISVERLSNKVLIHVQPELGESQIYTINFVNENTSNASLAHIDAAGLDFDPMETAYTLPTTALPSISFTRATDAQTVVATYTQTKAILSVTAGDGITKKTYVLNARPAEPTRGLLSSLFLDEDEIILTDGKYRIEHRHPDEVIFTRQADCDSVKEYICADSITLQVFGDAQHTYTIVNPSNESDNTELDDIWVNGKSLKGTDKKLSMQYIITASPELQITPFPSEPGQTISLQKTSTGYSISVVAVSGATATYTLTEASELSSNASLDAIYLDGMLIQGWNPDSLNYVVMLPTTNPKVCEPKMPSLTYLSGHKAQQVDVQFGGLYEPNYLLVTSEDGKTTRQYSVLVMAEPSHNADLLNIAVDGIPLNDFEPGRHIYSSLAYSTSPKFEYSSHDKFQTVLVSNEGNRYNLLVTAQDGVTTALYTIDVYVASASNVATLSMIYIGGDSLSGFQPMNNSYTIKLPAGTTILPNVSVVQTDDNQTVAIHHRTDSILIDVTAQDGISKNTYVLYFETPKSNNTQLSMIYLGNDSLPNFASGRYYYQVALPVGTRTLPVISTIKGESVQQVSDPIYTANNATISVVAEDGTVGIYTLEFSILRSTIDTLQMLFFDNDSLRSFRASDHYYTVQLPVGTTTFPELTWIEGDDWQMVIVDTIFTSLGVHQTLQIHVLAENGNQNIYTIAFEVLPSSVDTLKAIYVGHMLLSGYAGSSLEYSYILPDTATTLPVIEWEQGDSYQVVDTMSSGLNGDFRLLVEAQNGSARIYVIHFSVAKSTETWLDNIYLSGSDLPGFNEGKFLYKVLLPTNDLSVLPAVTVLKKHIGQNVSIEVGAEKITVHVLAEDGVSSTDYVILFLPVSKLSTQLAGIYLDDTLLEGFNSDIMEYTIDLPIGQDTLPRITYQLEDMEQQVETDTFAMYTVSLAITSAIDDQYGNYILHFNRTYSTETHLAGILIDGAPMENFNSDTLEYLITYPVGTPESELLTVERISYVLADTTQRAAVSTVEGMIILTVTAQSGAEQQYVIRQQIEVSSNSFLRSILLDDEMLINFDRQKYVYDYVLSEGMALPSLEAIPEDSAAEILLTLGEVGDTTRIFCIAPNGERSTYMIYFHYSNIRTGDVATANDVLLKNIGSHQFLAISLRENTFIALYDALGHCLTHTRLETVNLNSVTVAIDHTGHDLLIDATSDAGGAILTIKEPMVPYYYVFFYGEGTIIKSGTLMLVD